MPAGVNEAPGTFWHTAPAWQLFGWLDTGSQVSAHSGRRLFSRTGTVGVGAELQSIRTHCGLARIPAGGSQGQTISELSAQGSMAFGHMLPSDLQSPEQYWHMPVDAFLIWQGHVLPVSGWQGQLSHDAAACVMHGREQNEPGTP
jgi:hypothetical protein